MLRVDKIFNLHLLKFPRAKDKVARRNFITKRLALLSDTKRQIRIETIDDIFEIGEDTLGGFGAEVRNAILTLSRADMCFEHHVEGTGFAQRITIGAFDAFLGNRRIHLLHGHTIGVNAIVLEYVIGAKTAVINCVFT